VPRRPLDTEAAQAEGQTGHTRAVLKIEDGCDARCAYCIIPDLRGEPRSRSIESIQKEAAALAVRGFREIVLVGINLSRYGVGLPGHLTLADAVEAAAAPGIDRIRLGSLEPDAICEGLLERLAALSQFCPHFHVSLQSGSAETLKRMGRRYNPRQYMEKLESIRRYWPQAGITTDIIVGFPGETEEEFAESAAFAAGAGFLKVHVFPYSRRAGTRAAELPNQVPKAVREACATAMQAAAAPSSQAFLSGLLGSTAGVLFEEPVQDKPGWMRGYTSSYVDVEAKVGDGAKGEIIQILLTELDGDVMIGAAQPESYKR
jgi:threonylcarbamoyladenosine tRNA methylthiotransferase MtaB